MSLAPGVKVETRAAAGRRGDPTDTGRAFGVDFLEWGPHDQAFKVISLDDFKNIGGERVNYSLMADSLEAAFAEGLAECYIARQVGPAPVKASRILVDRAGVPVNTLRIDAIYVGDRGNRHDVQVQDGTAANTFRLVIFFDDVEVERFDNLVMDAASVDYAVTRLATSEYVRGVDLNSATASPNDNPAVLAASPLAGGTDDRANSTNVHFVAALALLTADLGPGQVFAPGRTNLDAHRALIDHCRTNNYDRTAYLDVPDQASKATLQAAVDAIEAYAGSHAVGVFGSWWDIPGLTTSTTRAVPHSAVEIGVTNRIDRAEGTAGAPAAGEAATAQYAIGVRVPAGGFSEADYADLNDNGVNMARDFGDRGLMTYGFRSASKDPAWVQLTAQRLRMSLQAKLEAAWADIPFRRIDGRGHLLSLANGKLKAVCKTEWERDALYGETQEEAFLVDTGDTVNTSDSIANGEVRAAVYARFAPYAEFARIDLVKTDVRALI